MTIPTLRTERLVLRAPALRDARVVTKALNDFAVSRWLTVVPFPYGMTDAEWFIKGCMRGEFNAWFIWAGDQFVGTIGLDDSLGYWIAQNAWGQGFATEAARAVLAHHFATTDAMVVSSSHFDGNEGSCNVLTKLGFQDVGGLMQFSKARGENVSCRSMQLTKERWQALDDG
jgi:RimJ/RimL family protein N-acetyltransferase